MKTEPVSGGRVGLWGEPCEREESEGRRCRQQGRGRGALVAWVHRVVIFIGGSDASVCNICLSGIDLLKP